MLSSLAVYREVFSTFHCKQYVGFAKAKHTKKNKTQFLTKC